MRRGVAMDTINATIQNGQIVPDQPFDWPEGSNVTVIRADRGTPTIGLNEGEWRTDPETIAQWLGWYDALEPLEFTPEEIADLAAWRQKQKKHDIAKTQERLQRLFE